MNIEPTRDLSLHIENKISFSLRSSFLLYDLFCSFMENEKGSLATSSLHTNLPKMKIVETKA